MNCLGIDLGTANTYIYYSDERARPEPLVIPGISDAKGSISTVTLYEEGKPILAGNVAEAEYYSHPRLQNKRRLASQFKPEIGLGDKDALASTTDFLRIIKENLPAGIIDGQSVLTVGIPSLAREDFRICLGRCFEQAGWPEPGFTRESDAALVSCLQAGSLHVQDLERKCLILDFGGGTCDYTSIENLDVLQSGGDILYGGRLFDDMIYQAFCRENPDLAKADPVSQYAWHAHWLECREQKERFSEFLAKGGDALTLRISWFSSKGESREAYLPDYSKEQFLIDAENYRAGPELLAMLEPYRRRGQLSSYARDLLAGAEIGLVSWFKEILESVSLRRGVSRVILTGGSSRWFFVKELCGERFPGHDPVESRRNYEDIAFGLCLFPLLRESQAKAQALLDSQFPAFADKIVAKAASLVSKQAAIVADLCSERIARRDIMPALKDAQGAGLTAAELEARFSANIESDKELEKIAAVHSEELAAQIQDYANVSFSGWLRENGVPLAPRLDFVGRPISEDFFKKISVKISRLDSLNIMAFTLQHIFPLLAATATAGAIAHTGELISTFAGGGAAYGAAWALAKAAPGFLEKRKLPSFILSKRNCEKIAVKNKEYIHAALLSSFEEISASLGSDIERRLRDSLAATLASLSALNQVQPN